MHMLQDESISVVTQQLQHDADGQSAWDAANSAALTPVQIAQLMPGYTPAPSTDGKGGRSYLWHACIFTI